MKDLLTVIAGARPTHLLKSYTVGDTHLVVVKPDVLPPAPNLVTIYDPTGTFVTIKYNGKRCNELIDCEYCEGIREYVFEAANSKAVRTIAEYDFSAIHEHLNDLESTSVKEIDINNVPQPAPEGKVNIPVASETELGVVKAGDNIKIEPDGRISALGTMSIDYNLAYNKPTLNGVEIKGDLTYANLGIASQYELGTIKVGNNLTIDPDGTLNAPSPVQGVQSDWAMPTPEDPSYIRNKPFLTIGEGLVVTPEGKLNVVAGEREQSDWGVDNIGDPAFIKNRPFKTIGAWLVVDETTKKLNVSAGDIQADWYQDDPMHPGFIKNKPFEYPGYGLNIGPNKELYVTVQGNVQADWQEGDETAPSFIKNKPQIYTKSEADATFAPKHSPISEFVEDQTHRTVTDDQIISWDGKVDKITGKGLSTNDYTNDDKLKVASVQTGAQKNVQSDWKDTDTESDAYIKNKPGIASASTLGMIRIGTNLTIDTDGVLSAFDSTQVQSDWDQTDPTKMDFIKNKPTNVSVFNNDAKYVKQGDIDTSIENHDTDMSSHPGIQQSITTETNARIAGDTALASRVDALEVRSDVVDVVACYDNGGDTSKTDLVHYDKSHLTDNDIIKVLTDETLYNKTTYYRYSIQSSMFRLIGSVGPYATTAELSLYVPNTRTINNKALVSSIVLTPEDIGAAPATHASSHLDGPDMIPDATAVRSGLMSALDNLKLGTIEQGAQKNVQPDWNMDIEEAYAHIKNRPFKTIGSGLSVDANGVLTADVQEQAQSDWNQVTTSAPSFIKNKPFKTIGTGLNVDADGVLSATLSEQIDWTNNDTTSPAYIKNKPFTTVNTDGLSVESNALKLKGKSIYTGTSTPSTSVGVDGDVYIQYTI